MIRTEPRELFKVSLLQPFRILTTETMVIFNALYNGYLYGLSFPFNGAFSLVFGNEGHEFDVISVGLSFLGMCVGTSAGPFANLWQEHYYQRRFVESCGIYITEARVQLGRLAAIW